MLKKLSILYLCIFITICNFNCVFADEELIDENLDLNFNESNEENIIEENIDENNEESTINNNNLQEQINDINNDLNNIKPLLLAINPNYIIEKKLNFNDINSSDLVIYYEKYKDYDFIRRIMPGGDQHFYYINEYEYLDDISIKEISGFYISNNGNQNNFNTNYIYALNGNANNSPFYKYTFNGESYCLIPYKLTINNNGLGEYTNSITTEPYVSTNIYYNNQSISLTYDDTNNDFTGWYDNNGNLLSNDLTYTFNITSDTNLVINYPINPPIVDTNNYTDVLMCIFIILLFFMFKSLIWGV